MPCPFFSSINEKIRALGQLGKKLDKIIGASPSFRGHSVKTYVTYVCPVVECVQCTFSGFCHDCRHFGFCRALSHVLMSVYRMLRQFLRLYNTTFPVLYPIHCLTVLYLDYCTAFVLYLLMNLNRTSSRLMYEAT